MFVNVYFTLRRPTIFKLRLWLVLTIWKTYAWYATSSIILFSFLISTTSYSFVFLCSLCLLKIYSSLSNFCVLINHIIYFFWQLQHNIILWYEESKYQHQFVLLGCLELPSKEFSVGFYVMEIILGIHVSYHKMYVMFGIVPVY